MNSIAHENPHPCIPRPRLLLAVLGLCSLMQTTDSRADLITREYWTNITGNTIANLTTNAAYPNTPSGLDYLVDLEATGWVGSANPGGTNAFGNNYGQRIRGYILPPEEGLYTFWIRSDNHSELWLSTNSNSANATRIAFANASAPQTDAGWTNSANQQSVAIYLTTGRKYIEVLHKEGTGSDHLAVGWLKPDESGGIPSEIIPGARLLPLGAPSLSQRESAARFLTQATFGPTEGDIDDLVSLTNNFALWITNQFNTAITSHLPPLLPMTNYYQLTNGGNQMTLSERRKVWMERAMTAPDQLRQRVAFALSEIFVISDVPATLKNNPLGMADYYDRLLTNSFGNFKDLLVNVSLHPAMGVYLSHLRNQKANVTNGTFPDENYAREVMQLFSVGLWMLNNNGTEITDTNGQPIATYSNGDITEVAKVFTGLNYPNSTSINNGGGFLGMMGLMKMYQGSHDTNSKTFLFYNVNNPGNKEQVPGGVAGLTDITNTVDVFFNHPNTPPFIARRLIQRLVTSSPTTDYINRVANKFKNNGSGVRGDMKAVVRQILMDTEARNVGYMVHPDHGRMREPYLLVLNVARAFGATPLTNATYYNFPNYWAYLDHGGTTELGMTPQSSPSVFNFFKPDYQPDGPVRDKDLYAPEFELLSHATANSIPNFINGLLNNGNTITFTDRMTIDLAGGKVTNSFVLNYSTEMGMATNVTALIDRVDELLTYGNLSASTRMAVSNAIVQYGTTQANLSNRVKDAIYLIATSPDCVIQK